MTNIVQFLKVQEQTDAAVVSLAESVQAITEAHAEYAMKALQDGSEFILKLTSIKAPGDLTALQTAFAKSAYETFLAESTKISELYAGLVNQAYKPLEGFVEEINPASIVFSATIFTSTKRPSTAILSTRGGAIVSARVLDSEVAHAVAILDIHRPVDVHDRAVTAGIAPAAHVEAVEKKIDAVPLLPCRKLLCRPSSQKRMMKSCGSPKSSWRSARNWLRAVAPAASRIPNLFWRDRLVRQGDRGCRDRGACAGQQDGAYCRGSESEEDRNRSCRDDQRHDLAPAGGGRAR